MIRILHVFAAVSPSGGVTEFAAQLALHQQQQGARVCIATLGEDESASIKLAQNSGVELFRFRRSFPNFLFFSLGMLRGLKKIVRDADVVHVHSNWTFPVWWGSWLALRCRKKLVMSPHGCLDPVRLRHSGWKKQCVGWLDRWCLQRAHILHATSAMEADWVRGYLRGNGARNIYVVPAGICAPPTCQRVSHAKKRIVFLGRLHPLKGIDLLVEAWAKLTPSHSGWELVIAGPDEQGTMEKLQHQTGTASIVLTGPAHGDAKWELLSSADIFVLPSRSENFGIVVGEALACGVPVVATKGAPWEKVEETGCGFWVDVSLEGIANGLSRMMRLSDEQRLEMGAKGRAWVAREFAWERIANDMIKIYQGVSA